MPSQSQSHTKRGGKVKCYVEDCANKVEWYIWVDGSVCCDSHAEPIGSYVDKLEYKAEAIPKGGV